MRCSHKDCKTDGYERKIRQQLVFSDDIETHDVPAYAVVHGQHPSTFMLTGPIGSLNARSLSSSRDPFTGLLPQHVRERKNRYSIGNGREREAILRYHRLEGSAWEPSTADLMNAVVASVAPDKPKAQEV